MHFTQGVEFGITRQINICVNQLSMFLGHCLGQIYKVHSKYKKNLNSEQIVSYILYQAPS